MGDRERERGKERETEGGRMERMKPLEFEVHEEPVTAGWRESWATWADLTPTGDQKRNPSAWVREHERILQTP